MALPSILAAPPALWTLIDEYILAVATAWSEEWLETADATIVIAEQHDPSTVVYPLIMIAGYERKMAEADAQFGDGEYHVSGLTYPYEIEITNIFDDFAVAKEFAAKASSSFVDALRADPAFGGLAADNGESVIQFDFDDGELFVRGGAGQDAVHGYTGTAVVRIIVQSEV